MSKKAAKTILQPPYNFDISWEALLDDKEFVKIVVIPIVAKKSKVYAIISLLFILEYIINGRIIIINKQNNNVVILISIFCMEDKFKVILHCRVPANVVQFGLQYGRPIKVG